MRFDFSDVQDFDAHFQIGFYIFSQIVVVRHGSGSASRPSPRIAESTASKDYLVATGPGGFCTILFREFDGIHNFDRFRGFVPEARCLLAYFF